ncbi:MAG: hypothetical protein ACRC3K_05180, partial [Plesiomonas sp.]
MKLKPVTPRNQVAAFKIDKAGGRVETLNGFHLVDDGHRVYTTGFNPTPEAIGATRERHWIGKVKLGSWSPVCRMHPQQHGAKMFITVGHTRGNFVANATFLVSCGHAGHGTVTQLESHGYSQIAVRVAMVGDLAEFEILDEDYGTTEKDTIVEYNVKVHGLFGGLTEYTSYTESTGNPMEVINTVYKAIKIGNNRVYNEGFKPSAADVGAFPITGGNLNGSMIGKQYVIAESPDGKNWVGMESSDGGVPYISAKHDNTARRVMEFNADGSISLPTTLHAQSINTAVWGNVLNSIGGSIRSNDASIMSLDGKVYSFVTSPMDAHLCQNSYWDGSEWRKYDANNPSGYLAIINGALKFNTSDAGVVDPRQRLESVYHTGYKPTPADIGAAVATEVYSKTYVDEKSWMRVADLRSAVRPPNTFNERSISTWFNESGNPTGGWYSGINVRGWADVYASWELLSGSDVPATHEADAYKTALWFRSGHGETWGEFQKVYTTKHKPTSEELNVIGMNKKNYLNNTDRFGVGFISGATGGAGWIATYHGTDAGTKVVMGSLSGIATIGAHSPNCDEWADLYINAQDGIAGVPKATIIGNPYAKNSGDTNLYRVYHQGFKPSAHEIGAAPDGFGVGNYGATIGTVLGDCNLRRQGGFFQGSNIEGIPNEGHTWKYVINTCHANAAGYFGYIAMDFDLNNAWLGG